MNIKKIIIILPLTLTLPSCSSIVPSGSEAAFKYLGIAKGVGDAALYSKTGKTLNDHLLSAAVRKDCIIGRIITKRPICVQIDPTHKYSIFSKGKVVSTNNVMNMKFPSEIYDFNKTLEKDLKKKLKKTNIKVVK